MKLSIHLATVSFVLLLAGCKQEKRVDTTPWGTVIGDTAVEEGHFSLDDIMSGGEIIVLTMSGPDTYYDYRGRAMGDQYLLCERFAQHIGVSVRVEVCADTLSMIKKLKAGDADMIVCPLPSRMIKLGGIAFLRAGDEKSGGRWVVRRDSRELAAAVDRWYKPGLLAEIKKEESRLLSANSVRRRVYSPMLDRSAGVISKYDGLFKRYARQAGMDWRLMAAQCYQESCFDPQAVSWAGARGLMQIMPATADHLGLPRSMMHDPESSIAASAKYMAEMGAKFRDVPRAEQRMYFALACYNGGYFHIRDAMALAKKNGKNPHDWEHVSQYVLGLSDPKYYRDPVVKYGYMRGTETVDYVARIRSRYEQYRGMTGGGGSFGIGIGSDNQMPHKASRKHRFSI